MAEMNVGFKEMIAQANAQVKTFEVKDAIALLEDESYVFVDLRDIRELQREGMIPNAFHCPRGMIEFWIHPDSPYHKPIFSEDKTFIFYCASGWRSALSGCAVKNIGFETIAHIEGGFTAWREAGGPVAQKEIKKRG